MDRNKDFTGNCSYFIKYGKENDMSEKYIIGIDQSTQGTKALLFDDRGVMLRREDIPHKQIINDLGWVSHNPEEIYRNTIYVVKKLITDAGVDKNKVAGIGISNQRETSVIWDKVTGCAMDNAIVWQCARATEICEEIESPMLNERIKKHTGLPLSPYFPAAKFAWLLKYTEDAKEKAQKHELCYGTIDTWLIYRLTKGASYKTDFSNAARTQLFNIFSLSWDENICEIFGINPQDLPEVCDSDTCFGTTDFEGFFDNEIPIHSAMGDSNGALFGHGCLSKGQVKATYGTGSSIMMNIGDKPVLSKHGVVTSLAWGIDGKITYVLEGNINYTGAVISWLKDDVELISSPQEVEEFCRKAEPKDELYFVPAFTGLGAPYWKSHVRGELSGITRTTRKAEIVRACTECIAYQIADVIEAMSLDADLQIENLKVDGGPTKNTYLMQFQSDMLKTDVMVPSMEELSGIGVAYLAGIALGIYDTSIFHQIRCKKYQPLMNSVDIEKKKDGWKKAVQSVCSKNEIL